MRVSFHVDVGDSDEIVVAEILVPTVQRGTTNTQWRAFVDLHRIVRSHSLSCDQFVASMCLVEDYRQATFGALRVVLDGSGVVVRPRWSAWRAEQKFEYEAPYDIDDLVGSLIEFTDPIVDGTAVTLVCNPSARA